MEKADILRKIKLKNDEISKLEASKRKYEKMNEQLKEALAKLVAAKNDLDNTTKSLKKNYSSQEADKENKNIQNNAEEVNAIIKKIKEDILPESNNKIAIINGKINEAKRERNRLEDQYDNME